MDTEKREKKKNKQTKSGNIVEQNKESFTNKQVLNE